MYERCCMSQESVAEMANVSIAADFELLKSQLLAEQGSI